MSDRELLEKAAGAFGVPAREEGGYMFAGPAEVSKSGWGIVTWMGYGTVQFWNPLESNDDALRLAVKLNLAIFPNDYPKGKQQYCLVEACHPDERPTHATELLGTDPYAATRRAIVRAAAALSPSPPADQGGQEL